MENNLNYNIHFIILFSFLSLLLHSLEEEKRGNMSGGSKDGRFTVCKYVNFQKANFSQCITSTVTFMGTSLFSPDLSLAI